MGTISSRSTAYIATMDGLVKKMWIYTSTPPYAFMA
jgi:hypothetical protein